MADTDTPATPVAIVENGASPTGDTTPTAAAQQPDEKRFTQAELNAAIEARLSRERTKAEKDTAKAKADAEADAAKRNGQWETVAKQHEARIKELEPITAQLETTQAERDALKGVVAAQLEAQRQGRAPEELELLDMVADPLKQLEWLSKHPLTAKQFARVPGTPPADDPKKLSESEIQRRRAEVSRYIGR